MGLPSAAREHVQRGADTEVLLVAGLVGQYVARVAAQVDAAIPTRAFTSEVRSFEPRRPVAMMSLP